MGQSCFRTAYCVPVLYLNVNGQIAFQKLVAPSSSPGRSSVPVKFQTDPSVIRSFSSAITRSYPTAGGGCGTHCHGRRALLSSDIGSEEDAYKDACHGSGLSSASIRLLRYVPRRAHLPSHFSERYIFSTAKSWKSVRPLDKSAERGSAQTTHGG